MDHQDHLRILRKGIISPGGKWAEFGSGRGAFTLALLELLDPRGTLYSVDSDQGALRDQERKIRKRFTNPPAVHFKHADYRRPLNLPPLDGVVMANTLHFYADKEAIISRIIDYLVPGGCLILVEYNSDQGNTWVPYPISFPSWEIVTNRVGFTGVQLLERVPSSFMGEIYSAISYKISDS